MPVLPLSPVPSAAGADAVTTAHEWPTRLTDRNTAEADDAIRARRNASDSLREFRDLRLATAFFAICSGHCGSSPCAQCAAAQSGVEGAAVYRERECVRHVSGLAVVSDPGHLAFARAVALAAYTKAGHGSNPRLRALHTHINRTLFNAYDANAAERATAVANKQLMQNLIDCLHNAVRDAAAYEPPAHVVSATDEGGTLHVFRGVGPWARDALCGLKKNQLRFMPGFCSTSTNCGIARAFAVGEVLDAANRGFSGALLHIAVPQNRRSLAAGIDQWSANASDLEVLIAAGAIVQVMEDVRWESEQLNPVPPTVHLRVVGTLNADGTVPWALLSSHAERCDSTGADSDGAGHHPGNSADADAADPGEHRHEGPTAFSELSRNVDPRTLLYFAERWAPPCELAAGNPIGLPLSVCGAAEARAPEPKRRQQARERSTPESCEGCSTPVLDLRHTNLPSTSAKSEPSLGQQGHGGPLAARSLRVPRSGRADEAS